MLGLTFSKASVQLKRPSAVNNGLNHRFFAEITLSIHRISAENNGYIHRRNTLILGKIYLPIRELDRFYLE